MHFKNKLTLALLFFCLLFVGLALYFFQEKRMWKWLYITNVQNQSKSGTLPDIRTQSLSSITLYGPSENSVRVYLVAANQKGEIIRGISCPYPELGMVVYSGNYKLFLDPTTKNTQGNPLYGWNEQTIDLGRLSFVQGVTLENLQIDPKSPSSALIFYQPFGCNKNSANVFGFDFKENKLVRYQFKTLEGQIEDEAINFYIDKTLTSGYYDQVSAKSRNSQWKFDPGLKAFIETKRWFD